MKKALSKYARIFSKGNSLWSNDPEVNQMVLRHQQNYANGLLRRKRIIFLNEVYEMLNFPRTQEGQVVGWYYDLENPIGDNLVDFNITEDPESGNFILDFNVDGRVDQYL